MTNSTNASSCNYDAINTAVTSCDGSENRYDKTSRGIIMTDRNNSFYDNFYDSDSNDIRPLSASNLYTNVEGNKENLESAENKISYIRIKF